MLEPKKNRYAATAFFSKSLLTEEHEPTLELDLFRIAPSFLISPHELPLEL